MATLPEFHSALSTSPKTKPSFLAMVATPRVHWQFHASHRYILISIVKIPCLYCVHYIPTYQFSSKGTSPCHRAVLSIFPRIMTDRDSLPLRMGVESGGGGDGGDASPPVSNLGGGVPS